MIRNTNVKPRRRGYSSELRDQQAEATRTLILEALVRTMGNGMAALSVPAVAREAGVSVPTIYRHFGSKQGLFDALAPYVVGRAGLMPERAPDTLDEFAAMARRMFRNLAEMDASLRAAMASEVGREVRRATMPKRRAIIREITETLAPDVPSDERERLADMALILLSTASFSAYRDYLDLGPDAASELASWAVATLIEGARSRTIPSEGQT